MWEALTTDAMVQLKFMKPLMPANKDVTDVIIDVLVAFIVKIIKMYVK